MGRTRGLQGDIAVVDRVDDHADSRPPLDWAAVEYRALGDVVGGDQAFEHGNIQRRAPAGAGVTQQLVGRKSETPSDAWMAAIVESVCPMIATTVPLLARF